MHSFFFRAIYVWETSKRQQQQQHIRFPTFRFFVYLSPTSLALRIMTVKCIVTLPELIVCSLYRMSLL